MPSTVIKQIDYDAGESCLTVTFTSGKVYRYDGVPADVYDAFEDASSKGSFFNRCIRDRYRTTPLPNRPRRQERSRCSPLRSGPSTCRERRKTQSAAAAM
jgi:KTSC domain